MAQASANLNTRVQITEISHDSSGPRRRGGQPPGALLPAPRPLVRFVIVTTKTAKAAPQRRRNQTAPPRRRADAERNIAAILDAALVCFAEDPGATMTQIARAAGVGRVTLYAHFPSRQQLLTAALDRGVAEATAALDASALEGLPADEAVGMMVRSSWHILDRHRMLFEAAAASLDHRQMRRHHDPVIARLDELVARGQAEGTVRSDVPRSWLVAVVFGTLHTAAAEVNARRLRETDAAETVEATLRSALAPPAT
jgi:AcrR family transcriptional regulator